MKRQHLFVLLALAVLIAFGAGATIVAADSVPATKGKAATMQCGKDCKDMASCKKDCKDKGQCSKACKDKGQCSKDCKDKGKCAADCKDKGKCPDSCKVVCPKK